MQLLSRMDMGVRRPPLSMRRPFQITNESTQAVMATPKAQPSLRVV